MLLLVEDMQLLYELSKMSCILILFKVVSSGKFAAPLSMRSYGPLYPAWKHVQFCPLSLFTALMRCKTFKIAYSVMNIHPWHALFHTLSLLIKNSPFLIQVHKKLKSIKKMIRN